MNAMLLLAQVAPALTDSISGANPVLTQVTASNEMNLWSMAVKGGCIRFDVCSLFLHLIRAQLCNP